VVLAALVLCCTARPINQAPSSLFVFSSLGGYSASIQNKIASFSSLALENEIALVNAKPEVLVVFVTAQFSTQKFMRDELAMPTLKSLVSSSSHRLHPNFYVSSPVEVSNAVQVLQASSDASLLFVGQENFLSLKSSRINFVPSVEDVKSFVEENNLLSNNNLDIILVASSELEPEFAALKWLLTDSKVVSIVLSSGEAQSALPIGPKPRTLRQVNDDPTPTPTPLPPGVYDTRWPGSVVLALVLGLLFAIVALIGSCLILEVQPPTRFEGGEKRN